MPRKKVEAHPVNHNGKDCWRVIIPKALNGGKPSRRYFDDEDTAEAYAADLESERRNAHARFLALPVETQNMALHAIDLIDGKGFDLVDAMKFFLAHNVHEPRTMVEAIAECIQRKRTAGRRAISLARLENTLNRFAKGRESKMVSEISANDCEGWICAPEAKSESTRRSRQIDLRTFFSFCVKRGWRKERPTDGLEKYTHGKQSPVILTVEQCAAVLNAAMQLHNSQTLATVVLQLFCGLRPHESYKVARAMIKDSRHLRLDETIAKTNDIRIVTINPTAKAWLAYAFKIGSPLPLRNWRNKIADIHAAVKPWPSDALRHSFVSYHLEIHGWELTVEQAGHSLATSFNHYRALTTKADARKFWALRPPNVIALDVPAVAA